jgi:hypothetical protein
MQTRYPLLRNQEECNGRLACTVAALALGAAVSKACLTVPELLQLIDKELEKACLAWTESGSSFLSVPEALELMPSGSIVGEYLCFVRMNPAELGGSSVNSALLEWLKLEKNHFCVVTTNGYSFAVARNALFYYVIDTHAATFDSAAGLLLRTIFPLDVQLYVEEYTKTEELAGKQVDLYILKTTL